MKLQTLFGQAKNGKIKEWSIQVVEESDGSYCIQSKHGYETGKKQIHRRYITKGKNIGRSNETTPYEQACLEAQSTHRNQKDSGYVEDKHKIPSPASGNFLPMLAHRYDKQSAKIKFPCWVQPKLDGIRMIAKKSGGEVSMWSRSGKPITIPNRIWGELCEALQEGDSVDGELYVHTWTFQRIVSAAKKVCADTDLLEYHIYDAPHLTKAFEERFPPPWDAHSTLQHVVTTKCKDVNEFEKCEQEYLSAGYEGMMARNIGSLYKFKHRSYDLQKVKRFIDDEYVIVGGKCGVGKERGLIVWRCVTKGGLQFSVRPIGDAASRAELYADRHNYFGKALTVRYQELTDDGVPRFPVGISIRDYE